MGGTVAAVVVGGSQDTAECTVVGVAAAAAGGVGSCGGGYSPLEVWQEGCGSPDILLKGRVGWGRVDAGRRGRLKRWWGLGTCNTRKNISFKPDRRFKI